MLALILNKYFPQFTAHVFQLQTRHMVVKSIYVQSTIPITVTRKL
jgi:hypothetical protein